MCCRVVYSSVRFCKGSPVGVTLLHNPATHRRAAGLCAAPWCAAGLCTGRLGCLEGRMSAMASQITGISIVCSIIRSGRSQKTSKLRVTGLCEGNSPVTHRRIPLTKASNTRKMISFDDVITWSIGKAIHVWCWHTLCDTMLCLIYRAFIALTKVKENLDLQSH